MAEDTIIFYRIGHFDIFEIPETYTQITLNTNQISKLYANKY